MNEQSIQYLKDKLLARYGEAAEDIFRGFTYKRKTTFRTNTLKTSTQTVEDFLAANAIAYEKVSWYDDAFILSEADEKTMTATSLYERGEIYLQSLSSMLPPLVLAPVAGEGILDMAAAPGGKTTQMAALTGGKAQITACERNAARAEKLKFNLQKQGAGRVTVLTQDARDLSDFFRFDQILLDAPCSGSGTVDLNDNFSKAEYSDRLLKKITAVQSILLQKAVTLLKKGQTMVYSTCSLFQEENEEQVKKILKSGSCALVPIEDKFSCLPTLATTLEGTLTVCPTELYEGFFVAKLKKL